ncbi:M1 family aminopeptidase [Pedobacter sp. AJM]|uniref:M1 family aminopeptidase n=1 Tax=Pedobacter sp. AJM TaxID=2003629 RepID=UPI000B4AFE16|nr:M1 family aminopeptidase [Pedobacter sp. AJM]OWK72373.1 hypothetical protein CBW18_02095 [Pedobacter sp. AJM]
MKPVLSLIAILFLSSISLAQSTANNLQHDVERCNNAFESGTIEDIKLNFPLVEQQGIILAMQKGKYQRKKGQSQIVKVYRDSALVLLTGTFVIGNSGDETDYSNIYSGIYVFKPVKGTWVMTSKLPVDRLNHLKAHRIGLKIAPVDGTIAVRDTMEILTREKYGFLLSLNHRAKIENVQLNQKKAYFVFDGGILWVKSSAGMKEQLILAYTLKVDNDPKNENSGYFDSNFGHVREQFYWHPFFNFSSSNDLADFQLLASIPSAYHVATGLRQTDRIVDDQRIITAKSPYATFALSLYYDKEWEVKTLDKGNYKFQIFGNKTFKPTSDTLYQSFSKTNDLLIEKFGKPQGNYLCIVQNRSKDFPIWLNRSNDMIVAGNHGGFIITNRAMSPLAPFGHEVAHAWTRPVGPATNFLREGWASFAEAYLLEKSFGDTTVSRFMANYKSLYFKGGFDGKSSLWDDASNNGVSYYKGVWVLYMLRDQLGKAVFDKGLKAFIQSKKQMDISLFIKSLSEAAGTDVKHVVEPWIKSKQVPHVGALITEKELSISQEGDVFVFPIDIAFMLQDNRIVRKTFNISKSLQSFQLDGFSKNDIKSIKIDPDNKLLIKIMSETSL